MKLLDCTLRDGGYYTNWDFKSALVVNYIKGMQDLPVDILEIGYRSTSKDEYYGKYFYLPSYALEEVSWFNSKREIAIMLNEKDIRPEHLPEILNGLKPVVTLIRLAIDPNNFDRAVLLGEAIRDQGFDIAFNIMYMSKYYKDKHFLGKLSRLNGLVTYLNLVDSFGGMYPNEVRELVINVKECSNEQVGFHGHNNLELAFANTLAAIDAGCEIVDGTILGMGRGAGNLRTELLLATLYSRGLVDFDFNILGRIVDDFTPLHEKYNWGTNLPYIVSGSNSLPQKDVMDWVGKRYYSFNSIIRALNNQSKGLKDNQDLPTLDFKNEPIFNIALVVGGGPSAAEFSAALKLFSSKNQNMVVIHASSKNAKYFEGIKNKQYYCLVGNEGHRMEEVFGDTQKVTGKCVLPPYPRKMGTYIPKDLVQNSYELPKVDITELFQDAHTALSLQLAKDLGVKRIYIAGYDGYSGDYISQREQELFFENEFLFSMLEKHNIEGISLTPTKYKNIKSISVFSLI